MIIFICNSSKNQIPLLAVTSCVAIEDRALGEATKDVWKKICLTEWWEVSFIVLAMYVVHSNTS